MGVIYTVVGPSTSVTAAAIDLVELVPHAARSFKLTRVGIGQATAKQDSQDSMCIVQICSGHTTGGSGGSAKTPAPTPPGSAATAGATSSVFNTTIASAGTKIILVEDVFDVRAGWLWLPTPAEQKELSNSIANNRMVVRLPVGPAITMLMSVTLNFEEIG